METKINRFGRNHLLSLIPAAERRRIVGLCEQVSPRLGATLYEDHGEINHVYFPLSGMISLVIGTTEGRTIEVGAIGNEGMVGTPLALGSPSGIGRAMVQVTGELLRMTAADFKGEVRRGSALLEVAQRFAQALTGQVSQSVACNHLHPIEERICRWLLMTHDRAGSDDLRLTQDFLSQMLGVRRPSVTVIAGALQREGLISYSRGRISVVDRAGLEKGACECYRLVRSDMELLLKP